MTSIPAYLGDAAKGDTITFRLPADTVGGWTEYTGVIWAYDRIEHAVGFPTIRFVLSGHVARGAFTCRTSLHIDLTKNPTPPTMDASDAELTTTALAAFHTADPTCQRHGAHHFATTAELDAYRTDTATLEGTLHVYDLNRADGTWTARETAAAR